MRPLAALLFIVTFALAGLASAACSPSGGGSTHGSATTLAAALAACTADCNAWSGGTCSCSDAGGAVTEPFHVTNGGSGNNCYPYASAGCNAGATKTGYVNVVGQAGSVCSGVDGCIYSGAVASGSPIAGYGGSTSNPIAQYAVTWVNTGQTCQSQRMTGVGTSLIDLTGIPGKITCPDGQVLTVSGGVGSCAAPSATSAASGTQQDPANANTAASNGSTAPGSSPNNPSYFDKSGLATDAVAQANANQAHADALNSQARQDATTAAVNGVNAQQGLTNSKLDAANAKLDQIHQDLKTGVKMDETGTPSDGSLAQQKNDFDNAATSVTDQITSIGGSKKVTTLDWVWSPTIPTGECEVIDLSGKWGTGLTIDACKDGHVDQLRAILAWVYAFCVAIYVWHRLSDAPGGGK